MFCSYVVFFCLFLNENIFSLTALRTISFFCVFPRVFCIFQKMNTKLFHIYIGALRPLSSNEAYKLEALSESYQRQVGTSIQRQQTSGLSTPLLSADRRRVSNEGDGSNEGTKEGESPKINVRRAKSGRRLVNQDKSKSFTAGGISGRDQNRARRAAPASVEHLMYAASSKTGESNNESGGSSRQPWKINRSEGESGGGGKTGR